MAVESSGAGVAICEEIDVSSGVAASTGESSGVAASIGEHLGVVSASTGESSGVATSTGEGSDSSGEGCGSSGEGCGSSGVVKIPSKSAAIEFITETTCAICLAQFQGLSK